MFYDEVGNLVRQIDAENHETKFEYDDHNRMSKRIDALGNEALFAYNLDGKMIKQTDAEGKITQYEYDNEGRMLKSIDGNANVIELVYDVPGGSGCASCGGGGSSQPARIKYPTFTKEFVYDIMGRKTEETDILDPANPVNPVKYVSSFVYDKTGNLIYQKDKEGKVTQYQYDVLNRLTKVINLLTNSTNGTNETSYIYDNRDNLLSLKDAKNQITRFEYDKSNRLTKETRPLSQSLIYTYDEIGNLKTRLDSKNQKTEYFYDDTGKLQEVKYYNPADPALGGINPVKNVSFTFDKIGNLKSYNDGLTQGQYQYDVLYRKTSETVNYGPFSKGFQYDYYKNGLKKTYTDPAGIAYTYSYDPNNQLASIQIPDQGNITYQAYKWLAPTQITLPGGTKKEYEYDPLMRIKKITSYDPGQNVLLNYQYSYDKMDNIRTKATEHGNYSYNYDDLYRLTDDQRPTTGEGYKYDEVGNRVTSVSGVTVNWAYNQNNELQNYDGVSFQYDANGNIIQKITDNGQLVPDDIFTSSVLTDDYTYDIENRLISVTRFTSGVSPFTVSYEYDPFGRRLWKEVDGTKRYFIYCDEGLAGELDQSGSLTKAYGWKPNSPWTTDPIFIREGESYYYYHNDHLGTPQKLTAQNGQVVWSAKYTAFGEAVIDPASTLTNNLRFSGQYYDSETGLHYNYNRYYDPRSGRYITPDPIKWTVALSAYTYVVNNPISYIDSKGLCELLAKFPSDFKYKSAIIWSEWGPWKLVSTATTEGHDVKAFPVFWMNATCIERNWGQILIIDLS
jgi:RHS repeat-associated protein